MALPFSFFSNSTERAFAPPAFQGSAPAPARLRRSGYATLPIGRRSLRKIPPWIFLRLQNCFAILHAAKPPVHGLFTVWQETEQKSITLLTCPLWLDTGWQETIPFPEPVEGNLPQKNISSKREVLNWIEEPLHTKLISYLVYIGKICKESTGMEGHNDSKCDKNPSMGFLRIGKEENKNPSRC